MYHNISRLRTWLALVLAVLMLTASCAPSGAFIKVDTSASSFQVNDTLTVSIKAENVADLTAFEAHLSFDKNVLEVVEVVGGKFVEADFVVQNTFDNTAGTVDYAIAQIDRTPASGNGTLFEIVFRAKAKGNSPLHFYGTQATPAGVLLSDPNGQAIQVSLMDGSVSVK